MTEVQRALLNVACVAIAGICLAAVVLPPDKKDSFALEGGKGLIQLLLVTVIGGGLAEVLRIRDDRKALRDRDAELRRRLQAAGTKAYLYSKSTRRILRADAEKGTGRHEYVALPYRSYRRGMRALNHAQLQLERLVRELDVTTPPPVWQAQVIDTLGSMEKYLGGLVSEYETTQFAAVPNASLPVDRLDCLRDFIGTYKDSNFQKFTHAHDTFLQIMAGQSLRGEAPGASTAAQR